MATTTTPAGVQMIAPQEIRTDGRQTQMFAGLAER